ncbi:hypothetical protein Pth03_78360 [Planotetraspora thailandica]|uniref:Uncharacterized protein n=1 Tax=Planotetraspora thailandica TaxID=487172 RepID=A0A8J4DG82_9ACTN|nr:hypothetical protein Pth03_78360 [Planotetraspora thailandica]
MVDPVGMEDLDGDRDVAGVPHLEITRGDLLGWKGAIVGHQISFGVGRIVRLRRVERRAQVTQNAFPLAKVASARTRAAR